MALKRKVIGYTVTVNGQPTGLALVKGMADIVSEGRSSLKGTRLAFDTTVTVFPTRKAANRAIARTEHLVETFNSLWFDANYEVKPLVVLK